MSDGELFVGPVAPKEGETKEEYTERIKKPIYVTQSSEPQHPNYNESEPSTTTSSQEQFVGPCALAITYDDIIGPAKVLVDLSKDIKELDLKLGQISGKPIDLDSLKKLAVLPGRDQLLAQVLSAMNAVPISLVSVLNGIMLKMMNVLKAIETNKGNEKLSADR